MVFLVPISGPAKVVSRSQTPFRTSYFRAKMGSIEQSLMSPCAA